MSKSLGNSPDPIGLIEKYGADGVRVGMLLCSSAGNDLLFDESLTEQGRNFSNKIWNAYRLVHGWRVDASLAPQEYRMRALDLFEARMSGALEEAGRQFDQYRIPEALMELYRLFWDDFSSWALEMVKPLQGEAMSGAVYERVRDIFDSLLAALHPFMPFLTEELWHQLRDGRDGRSLMLESWPEVGVANPELLSEFEAVKGIVSQVRAIRQGKGIGMREGLALQYRGELPISMDSMRIVERMAAIEGVSVCHEAAANSAAFMVGRCEFFLLIGAHVNCDEERDRLLKDLEYAEGFRAIVLKKLGNERFVSGAPASVVEVERKKLQDAEAKIEALRKQLEGLGCKE